jgi:hypothetical protein
LQRISKELLGRKKWPEMFKGVAAVQITTDSSGPTLSLRLSKKEGIPIQVVPEGTPDAAVVAVKKVNELDFYSLGAKQLAKKVNLTMPKVIAVVDYLGLRKDGAVQASHLSEGSATVVCDSPGRTSSAGARWSTNEQV